MRAWYSTHVSPPSRMKPLSGSVSRCPDARRLHRCLTTDFEMAPYYLGSMTPSALLPLLRRHAERCLAAAAPTREETRALASLALDLVTVLEAVPGPASHPYRSAPGGAREADMAALVALERALDACEARLGLAMAEIAALRAGHGSPGRAGEESP